MMASVLPESAKQPKEMMALTINGSFAITIFALIGDWKWEK